MKRIYVEKELIKKIDEAREVIAEYVILYKDNYYVKDVRGVYFQIDKGLLKEICITYVDSTLIKAYKSLKENDTIYIDGNIEPVQFGIGDIYSIYPRIPDETLITSSYEELKEYIYTFRELSEEEKEVSNYMEKKRIYEAGTSEREKESIIHRRNNDLFVNLNIELKELFTNKRNIIEVDNKEFNIEHYKNLCILNKLSPAKCVLRCKAILLAQKLVMYNLDNVTDSSVIELIKSLEEQIGVKGDKHIIADVKAVTEDVRAYLEVLEAEYYLLNY